MIVDVLLRDPTPIRMDEASRIIAAWKDGRDVISREAIAISAWKKAVGKRVALRTKPVKLVRNTLIVEVEDDVWLSNLWSLRYQILRNLEKAIGPEIVQDLQLMVMPPRREPQRESERVPDEADGIADPGLRRIYRAARRRESA